MSKDDHLTDNPPTNETREEWLRDDASLFLQIKNSIDTEVVSLINHCEYVKDLMEYLEFFNSGKGTISHIYEVCKGFYHAEQQDQSLQTYFMNFKRIYEELNVLLPFSADVKVQKAQQEWMAVISFLADLNSQFEVAKSQILYSAKISSLHEVFTKVLCTDINALVTTPGQTPSALISHKNAAETGQSH